MGGWVDGWMHMLLGYTSMRSPFALGMGRVYDLLPCIISHDWVCSSHPASWYKYIRRRCLNTTYFPRATVIWRCCSITQSVSQSVSQSIFFSNLRAGGREERVGIAMAWAWAWAWAWAYEPLGL